MGTLRPIMALKLDEYECREPGMGQSGHEYSPAKFSVSVLPTVQPFSLSDDQLVVNAVMCVLGEHGDMAHTQANALMSAYYDRPACINMRDWMTHLVQLENGLLDQKCRQYEKQLYKQEVLADVRDDRISKMFSIIKKSREMIRAVVRLDLRRCTWAKLNKTGLRPLTCSYFLMHTRPCEHVALTEPVLEWMRRVPAISEERKGDKKRDFVPPDKPPTDAVKYMDCEWRARRMQRLFYPGFTSLEAERMILHGYHGWLS